jgi:hypothetical protein
MPLLLNGEELLNKIEVSRKTANERHTEEQEHSPHFVLNTEFLPPLCGPSTHQARSFRFPH